MLMIINIMKINTKFRILLFICGKISFFTISEQSGISLNEFESFIFLPKLY